MPIQRSRGVENRANAKPTALCITLARKMIPATAAMLRISMLYVE
jgi:hypothetical protein